jgi:glycerophosphoryl diester phosphodiesterase
VLSYRAHVARPGRLPLIVVHRGAWTEGPENSLQAIGRAFDAGHSIVEVDVQESADGVLFLMHDDTLDRMTGGTGPAAARTMADLSALRLRQGAGGPDAALSDQPIPTLDAVLALTAGRGYLDLDVKVPALIERVAEAAAAAGAADRVDVKFPLRGPEDLARIARIEAATGVMAMPMSRVTADDWTETVARVIDSGAVLTEMKFDTLDTLAAAAGRLSGAGVSVWVNTLDPVSCAGLTDSRALADPDAVWGRLVEAGVSVIQTDVPADLARWLGGRASGADRAAG